MKQTEKRPFASIVMHPRQRKLYEPEHVEALAASIRRTKGLIHPIVLDPSDESLVAGGRRLLAYQQLAAQYPSEGWDEIPFIYKGHESDLDRKVSELEENLARVDLQWWEKAAAIAEIHETQKEIAAQEGKEWGLRQTAEITNVSLGTVQNSLEIVKAAEKKPEIRKEQTLSGAMNKVKAEKQLIVRKAEIEARNAGRIKTFPAEILVGDSRELIRKEEAESFDAIVTNFPFGVEYGHNETSRGSFVYDDDEDMVIDLVRDIITEGFRVLKNDSWFLGFFASRKITYSNKQRKFLKAVLPLIKNRPDLLKLASESMNLSYWFEEAGFSYVRLLPIVWVKPNKTQGNIGNPRKGLISAYETAILAAKGDAILMKQGKQDILIYDSLSSGEREFEMQMPRELCAEIVSWLVMGGARVLDPFAGVGGIGEGALDNQCSFRGFELNAERAGRGNVRLQEHFFAKGESNNGES